MRTMRSYGWVGLFIAAACGDGGETTSMQAMNSSSADATTTATTATNSDAVGNTTPQGGESASDGSSAPSGDGTLATTADPIPMGDALADDTTPSEALDDGSTSDDSSATTDTSMPESSNAGSAMNEPSDSAADESADEPETVSSDSSEAADSASDSESTVDSESSMEATSDEETTTDVTPPTDESSDSQPLSFETDIWPIYEMTRDPEFVYPGGTTYAGCTTGGVCHGGERPGANLSMTDAATAYEQLVGVDSVSSLCDGTIRVVPGDPDQSCLILFYEGRLMEELDWVDESEIEFMREWIRQGAQP